MNTRARVATWLANYECGGCTAATFEDAADQLIAVVFTGDGSGGGALEEAARLMAERRA